MKALQPIETNRPAVAVPSIFDSLREIEYIEALMPFCEILALVDPEAYRLAGDTLEAEEMEQFLAAEDINLLADIIEFSTNTEDMNHCVHTAAALTDTALQTNRKRFYKSGIEMRRKAYALTASMGCFSDNVLVLRVGNAFGSAKSVSTARLAHLLKVEWTKFDLEDDRSPAVLAFAEPPPMSYLGDLAKLCEQTNAMGCFPVPAKTNKKDLDEALKKYALPDSPHLFATASYGFLEGITEDGLSTTPQLALAAAPSLAAVIIREKAGDNPCNKKWALPLTTALHLDYEIPDTDAYVKQKRLNALGRAGQIYGGVTLSGDSNQDLRDLPAMVLRAQIARELSMFARKALYTTYDGDVRKLLLAALLAYFGRYRRELAKAVEAKHINITRNPITGAVEIDVNLSFKESIHGFVFSIRSATQQVAGKTQTTSSN